MRIYYKLSWSNIISLIFFCKYYCAYGKIYMYMYMYICIYGIHTTERFLEVAIKVGLGLNGDLNPQPLNSVETL